MNATFSVEREILSRKFKFTRLELLKLFGIRYLAYLYNMRKIGNNTVHCLENRVGAKFARVV